MKENEKGGNNNKNNNKSEGQEAGEMFMMALLFMFLSMATV